MKILTYSWLAAMLLVAGFTSCEKDDDKVPAIVYPEGYTGRLQYQLEANYNFSQYVQVQNSIAPSLKDTLRSDGPFTVIVFSQNPLYYASFWGESFGFDMLRYGIIRGNQSFRKLPLGMHQPLPTLFGQDLYVSKYLSPSGDTIITVNGSKVTAADNAATNGLIQAVDLTFPPPYFTVLSKRISSDTSLSMFATAIQRAGLSNSLDAGNYTVMAPANNAFLNSNTAALGMGISTMDSLLLADPAMLKRLVENHIITDGMLFNSDMQKDYVNNLNQPVYYNTLGGQQIKYEWMFSYMDQFSGNGNTIVAGLVLTNQVYRPVNNEVAGKNVINRINQILVP